MMWLRFRMGVRDVEDWFLRSILPLPADEVVPFNELRNMWRTITTLASETPREYVAEAVRRYLAGATLAPLSLASFHDMIVDLPFVNSEYRKVAVVDLLEAKVLKSGYIPKSYSNVADAVRALADKLKPGALTRAQRLLSWYPLGLETFWVPNNLIEVCIKYIRGEFDGDDDENIWSLFHQINSMDIDGMLIEKAQALNISFEQEVMPHWILAWALLGPLVPAANQAMYRWRYYNDIIDLIAQFAEYEMGITNVMAQRSMDTFGGGADGGGGVWDTSRFLPVVLEVYDYVTDRSSTDIRKIMRLNVFCYTGNQCTHTDRYILKDPAQMRKMFDYADYSLLTMVQTSNTDDG